VKGTRQELIEDEERKKTPTERPKKKIQAHYSERRRGGRKGRRTKEKGKGKNSSRIGREKKPTTLKASGRGRGISTNNKRKESLCKLLSRRKGGGWGQADSRGRMLLLCGRTFGGVRKIRSKETC